jgi:ADP-L-glycero-D-manno-heptose 6-epimerase
MNAPSSQKNSILQAGMKPILVTGAGGFVGSRFVERCNSLGIETISVDAPSYFTDRSDTAGVRFGKIIDREKLFAWLDEETRRLGKSPISAFVHLGACTDTTQLDEAYLSKMNLEYSKSAWNYCVQHALPLVYASSAATYGEGELGYDDDDALTPKLKPLNPYGESKRAFDEWAFQEEKAGRSPPNWSGFKFFNVYGFGEGHKGKMASVILHAYRQILATGEAKLFKSHREGIADGEQKRDFIWVNDLIDVLFFALEKPIRRGVYNLGTGQARTFLDLVRATFKAMGKPERIEFIPTPESLRARYQYFTEAKMDRLRAQGFTAKFTSLEEGVRKYIERLDRK